MIIDYLDWDVAYLLGLIVGRSKIIESENSFVIIITFPFKNPEIEGFNQFEGFVASISTVIYPRIRKLVGMHIDLKFDKSHNVAELHLVFERESLIVRNLKFLLGENYNNYALLEIPETIRKTDNIQIIEEFLRGFCDVSANIRKSNRDINRLHRVYVDVLNKNWILPVQICELFQDKLGIPVANIIWGHPNMKREFREHQIRIYAHEFIKLGFYVNHKQSVLKILAEENMNYTPKFGDFCKGYRKKYTIKPRSDLESDQRLPENIRGKHFNVYWEICAEFGCKKAKEKVGKYERERLIWPD